MLTEAFTNVYYSLTCMSTCLLFAHCVYCDNRPLKWGGVFVCNGNALYGQKVIQIVSSVSSFAHQHEKKHWFAPFDWWLTFSISSRRARRLTSSKFNSGGRPLRYRLHHVANSTRASNVGINERLTHARVGSCLAVSFSTLTHESVMELN